MAQVIVVVQILVAKRDAMHARGDQRFDRVLDAVLPAAIPETSRNLPGQGDTAIGLAQQQQIWNGLPSLTPSRPFSRLCAVPNGLFTPSARLQGQARCSPI